MPEARPGSCVGSLVTSHTWPRHGADTILSRGPCRAAPAESEPRLHVWLPGAPAAAEAEGLRPSPRPARQAGLGWGLCRHIKDTEDAGLTPVQGSCHGIWPKSARSPAGQLSLRGEGRAQADAGVEAGWGREVG